MFSRRAWKKEPENQRNSLLCYVYIPIYHTHIISYSTIPWNLRTRLGCISQFEPWAAQGLNVWIALLGPLVGLHLWINHQWPTPGVVQDDRIVNGQGIVRQVINDPLPDLHFIADTLPQYWQNRSGIQFSTQFRQDLMQGSYHVFVLTRSVLYLPSWMFEWCSIQHIISDISAVYGKREEVHLEPKESLTGRPSMSTKLFYPFFICFHLSQGNSQFLSFPDLAKARQAELLAGWDLQIRQFLEPSIAGLLSVSTSEHSQVGNDARGDQNITCEGTVKALWRGANSNSNSSNSFSKFQPRLLQSSYII